MVTLDCQQFGISIRHLNADTSWLLSVSPTTSNASSSPSLLTLNVLIDPWFTGWQTDYHPLFSRQRHIIEPCANSIPELLSQMPEGQQIDAILVCHPFTDHCDETTLRTGSPSTPIFVHHAIVERVKGWKFFERVSTVPVHRDKVTPARLCSSSSTDSSPEIAISALYFPPDRFEMAGDKLHGCTLVTITLSGGGATPKDSEQLFYVLYAPHGTYVSVLKSWLDAHPHAQCLALIHGFDEIDNPWYLAGQLNLGVRTGPALCSALKPKYWLQTHDEMKEAGGFVAKVIERRVISAETCQKLVSKEAGTGTQVRVLESGESLQMLQISQ